MNFLNPWVALGIAAAVIPLLVLLYFLKLRRREEVVPSTLLWRRAIQDLQVNAPFQKLRKNLLLLLQLLVLAAALIALARPIVQSSATDEARVVILIDRSGSMNTLEAGGKTRLDLAKEQAVRLAKTLNRTGAQWWEFWKFGGAESKTRAMAIAFADRATVIAPFTANMSELIDRINAIEPTDGRTKLKEALELAQAYIAPPSLNTTPVTTEVPAKMVLISDGCISDVQDIIVRTGKLELVSVGERQDNIGITSLRAQRNYERPELVEVYATIENFGPAAVEADVSFYLDGELVKPLTRTFGSAPRKTPETQPAETGQPPPAEQNSRAVELSLPLPRAGVLEARIAHSDGLAADNSAFAVIAPPKKLRVLLVGPANGLIQHVLPSLPLREVVRVTPQQYDAMPKSELQVEDQSSFDVVIFSGHNPGKLPVGNYLFFGCVPQVEGLKVKQTIAEAARLLWWDETNPLLRGVALDYVVISDYLSLELPKGTRTIVEGPQGPAVVRFSQEGRQYLIVTFPVEKSTWPTKLGFPIFVYNALPYLANAGGAADQDTIRPGDTVRMPVPPGTTEAVVKTPTGDVSLRPDSAGLISFGGTEHIGVYHVKPGVEGRDTFAVNLADSRESDIRPLEAKDLNSTQIQQGKAIHASTPEIWRWFVGAALLLVLLEWYIYNRRVMI